MLNSSMEKIPQLSAFDLSLFYFMHIPGIIMHTRISNDTGMLEVADVLIVSNIFRFVFKWRKTIQLKLKKEGDD